MKEHSFVTQCLDILKRDDVKKECKQLLKPFKDFILYEIQPYIYITVALIFLIFIMILAILILLIFILYHNNNFSNFKFFNIPFSFFRKD